MNLSISALHAAYRSGELSPRDLVAQLLVKIQGHENHNAWISVLTLEQLEPCLARLATESPDTLPLFGVPFAIKDNIDLAGVATTAACEAYGYVPEHSATVVERLVAAGAIPLGKTNLDQFATGLVGTRSPFGIVKNSFDPHWISGGSSSGSAVAVALGEVSFALGTDTAGSGRVPAAFNNLLGIKPSLGRWSCHGLVPACKTLDCPTIFTLQVDDAQRIGSVLDGIDERDPFSRERPPLAGNTVTPVVGVPSAEQLRFFDDGAYQQAFNAARSTAEELGWELREIDFSPFAEAAELLYAGPWVAERLHTVRDLLASDPDALLPVIRTIIEPAAKDTAVAAFDAQYQLAALAVKARRVLAEVDALLLPTTGGQFRIDQVEQEPVARNSELGWYTNFMNLLDMAAVAVPAGFVDNGLPFGVTLCAAAGTDQYLLQLAARWLGRGDVSVGACGHRHPDVSVLPERGHIPVAVCGAHLQGMPLNPQLTERGATLLQCTQTAPSYRFYALAGGPPYRPGLVRDEAAGKAIDVEVWAVPAQHFGSFVAGIPAPLGIGKLELADGEWVSGFICEPAGIEGAEEITELGGWRKFVARQ